MSDDHVQAEVVMKAIYKVTPYASKNSTLYKLQLPAWWCRAKVDKDNPYVAVEFLSDGSLRIRPATQEELLEAGRVGG